MVIKKAPVLVYDEDDQTGFTLVGEAEITSHDSRVDISLFVLNKEHDDEALSLCSFKMVD